MNKTIQFLHPGVEYDSVSGLNWNSGNHKRKFTRLKGSYVNHQNEIQQGKLSRLQRENNNKRDVLNDK